jgi:hypothetical protein
MRRIMGNVQVAVEAALCGILLYSTLYVFFEMAYPGSTEKTLGFTVPVRASWVLVGIAASYLLGVLFTSLNAYYERRLVSDDLASYASRRASYRRIYSFFIVGFFGIFFWLESHLFDMMWILGSSLLLVSYVMIYSTVFGNGRQPSS